MATNNQLLNRPPLRFPEFSDEWQRTTLEEIGEIRMCKRILANQTNKEGGVPFFKIGTIGKKEDSYISETLFQEYKSKYHYPNKGQILITCAGTIGRCIIFDGYDAYYQDSNIVWIDNEENRITNPYLFYLLDRTDWSRLNTSTIVRLYNDDLRALSIPLPSLAEQEKIASFLSLLDERIEAQRQTIEERKKQKKALLQQIFSQSLRFPEFEDEWQQTTNAEVFSNINERNRDLQRMTVLSASQSIGMASRDEIGIDIKYKRDSLSTYKLVNKGDYVVHLRSFQGGFAFSDLEGICSPAYSVLRPTNRIGYGFLKDYFKSAFFIKSLVQVTYGIRDGRSISTEEWMRESISLPSLAEQSKISELFTTFDERIEVEEALLTCYEAQKRYLLRQMFV